MALAKTRGAEGAREHSRLIDLVRLSQPSNSSNFRECVCVWIYFRLDSLSIRAFCNHEVSSIWPVALMPSVVAMMS